MATINLGAIKFNWKGAYSGATAYVVDDVVESSGSSYICIAATTGNAPPNASYWEQMSSAGTNGTDGTDLTTTLTTQGDLVYRDGSGLQRLGAGTSGQVLQTNGTGANPSWGTVSSDYVKINSGSFSNVSSVELDGTSVWGTSGTYKWHKLVFTKWQQQNSANLLGRQVESGSQQTGQIYATSIDYGYSNGATAYHVGVESDEWRFTNDNLRGDASSTAYHKIEFSIFGLYGSDSNDYLKMNVDCSGMNQDDVRRMIGFDAKALTATNSSANTARTGLKFYTSSGNVSGNWITYGIKG